MAVPACCFTSLDALIYARFMLASEARITLASDSVAETFGGERSKTNEVDATPNTAVPGRRATVCR